MNRTNVSLAIGFFVLLGALIWLRPKRQYAPPPIAPVAAVPERPSMAPRAVPPAPVVRNFPVVPRPPVLPVPPPKPPRKLGSGFAEALPVPDTGTLPTGEKSASLRRLELFQPKEGTVEPEPSGKMPDELPMSPVAEGPIDPQEMDIDLPQIEVKGGAVDPPQ